MGGFTRNLMIALVMLMGLAESIALAQQADVASQQGKDLGTSLNPNIYKNITTGNPASVVPGYNKTAPQKEYFQGGQGSTVGPGTVRVAECSAQGDVECQAVNLLQNGAQTRPQFNISKNDPLIVKGKELTAYPGGQVGDIFSTYENCNTTAKVIPPIFEKHVCNDFSTAENMVCIMGQQVEVNPDSNFKCDQTINAFEVVSCLRASSVLCTGGGTGCSPSGIKTDSVTITGFGRFLVHPTGDGQWFVSTGTIAPDGSYINNYNFKGSYYNVYESNTYFYVIGKDDITTFYLDQILYDDNIAVWLNGRLIFHSTGGNDLSICKISGITNGVSDGVHACSQAYFQGGANVTSYGGVELKSYLVEGVNHVRIKVAVGENGDAIARFRTMAKCPLSCSVSTNNQCVQLEQRAK